MSGEDLSKGQPEMRVHYADDWLNNPEKIVENVQRDADGLERQFKALGSQGTTQPHAMMNPDALTILVLEPKSQTIIYPSDVAPVGANPIEWDEVARALEDGETRILNAPTNLQKIITAIYVPAKNALSWNLPPNLHPFLAENTRHRVVMVVVTPKKHALEQACHAYGLTGLEARVVAATLRAGTIRNAATVLAISYATAREAMSAALKKVGVTRMHGLIYRLSLHAFGILPNSGPATGQLVDRWGLSPRQAQILMLIANGLTREQCARALGLSEATVKKQMDVALQLLGVPNVGEAAQAIAGIVASQALLEASKGQVTWGDVNFEPLRFVLTRKRRRIALSDYGPVRGKPVLILHSSMTTRHPPRKLVQLLGRAGYRVLAIDRPGFGLTDPVENSPHNDADEEAVFFDAADDMAEVLDHFGIDRVDLVARGGAQVAVAFAERYPERCGTVVLVNPDPTSRVDKRRWGVLGAFKEAYYRRPALIGLAARLIISVMTREFLGRTLRSALKGSPPDEAALSDEYVVDDYFRAVRMLRHGHIEGYVREQTYFAISQGRHSPVKGEGWRVLIGAHDTLSDPRQTRSYWFDRLPNASFEIIEDGGRLLAYARPELIVQKLHTGK